MDYSKAFGVSDLFWLFCKTSRLTLSTGVAWTAAVEGTGITSLAPGYIYLNTGLTASSTALLRAYTIGMGAGEQVIRTFNFAKRFSIGFTVGVDAVNANSVRYVQLKAAATIGDLAAPGIGIKIVNATLYGESYGSERGTIELMTLTSTKEYQMEIQHNPIAGEINFCVGGVLKGQITTAAYIPNATEALVNMFCSVSNGATGAEIKMFVSPPELVMEI